MIEASDAIDSAVEKTLNQGYRTGDIFQGKDGEIKVNTAAMGDAIIANL
jgi:3-isopropylmalate dehydrogenase